MILKTLVSLKTWALAALRYTEEEVMEGELWGLPLLPPFLAGRKLLGAPLQKRPSGLARKGGPWPRARAYELVRSWYLVPEALMVVSNLHIWINPQLSENCCHSSLSLLLVGGRD